MLTSLAPPATIGFSLAAIGMPGCSLSLRRFVAQAIAKNGSVATWSLQVPVDPNLVGLRFSQQALVFDRPSAGGQPNAFGAILSNPASGAIGAAALDRVAVESFDQSDVIDFELSSGRWRLGVIEAGTVGGDGAHGAFDITQLPTNAAGEHVWDTDQPLVIPSAATLLGQRDLTIANGQASFSTMTIPAGETLRLVGSQAPVIRVSGTARIEGRIEIGGQRAERPSMNETGGAGGIPGAGGGAGGRGADSWLPSLPNVPQPATPTAANRGSDGEDLRAPATSGYAGMTAGTGGRGAPWFPASGLHVDVDSTVQTFYSASQIAGGGGGGHTTAGQAGRITTRLANGANLAPAAPPAGGAGVPFALPPSGVSSLEHFLLGGSGGGGGGSVSTLVRPSIQALTWMRWTNGFGGGGGGGALGLRVGAELFVSSTGVLSARGGDCDDSLENRWTSRGTSVAGGGSGGSVVLQVAGVLRQLGTIDVTGGRGGLYTGADPAMTARAGSAGGAGAPGYVRIETVGIPQLGTIVGPAVSPDNFGMLTERDARSIVVSKWLPLPASRTRQLRFYEVDARVDGLGVRFTDDPFNPNPANVAGQPVRIYFQGAQLDPATGLPTSTPGPWVDGARELGLGNPSGYRFLIEFDRTTASQILVDEVRIDYRG